MKLMTDGGYSMYTMSSMLQKAIRRSDINRAAFAAKELRGRYPDYLWKRLYVISAEDCYGVMTKEIVALKIADDTVNKGRKGYDRDSIFLSKAVTLLCMARKNRDACYVACNFMSMVRTLKPEEIPDEYISDIDEATLGVDGIPDWVFDVHTFEGRRKGKTEFDMIVDEQAALKPLQLSLFDEGSWEISNQRDINEGRIDRATIPRVRAFERERELDPTHYGEDMEIKDPIW